MDYNNPYRDKYILVKNTFIFIFIFLNHFFRVFNDIVMSLRKIGDCRVDWGGGVEKGGGVDLSHASSTCDLDYGILAIL